MEKQRRKWMVIPVIMSMLAALLTMVPEVQLKAASAETDFIVSISGNTCTITGYKGTKKDVAIPRTIGGKRVTAIGANAFASKGLTSVEIPFGVTEIGASAFTRCQLKKIVIPGSVSIVKNRAFMLCSQLEEVVFMYGIETIEDNAFSGCTKLSVVTMANSVSQIGGTAFAGARGVELESNTAAPAYGYQPTSGSVTKKQMASDNICNYDYDMDAEGNVTIKGYYGEGQDIDLLVPDASAFGGTEIVAIEEQAFQNKKNLYRADFSNSSIKSIGANAFAGCGNLREVILPDTITFVGDGAFDCNDGTEDWTLNIVSDSDAVIEYILNSGLKISFKPYSPGLSLYHDLKFRVRGNGYIRLGVSATYKTGFTMKIEAQPYNGYEFVGWETDGGGTFDIPSGADPGDTSQATAFTMPNNDVVLTAVFQVKKRPDWVIEQGVVLEYNLHGDMNIPATWGQTGEDDANKVPTTEIAGNVFYYGGTPTKVTIPASITTIASRVFDDSRCYGLTEIQVASGNSNFSSQDGVLFNKNKTELICYPQAKTGSTYTIPSTVTKIAAGAFYNCRYLENVVIPAGVTNIPSQAFYNCSRLKQVAINGAVANIDSYAFAYCGGLSEFTIPESVTAIGYRAFYGSGLKKITIPAGVGSIGDGAFSYCGSLKEILVDPANTAYVSLDGVLYNFAATKLITYPGRKETDTFTVPDDVEIIGDYAFYGNSWLKTVNFGTGLKTIGNSAFEDCYILAEINYPASFGLESIGSYAFDSCQSLTSIVIPESVASIGNQAFRYCKKVAAFQVDSANVAYMSDAAGALYDKAQTRLIAYPAGSSQGTYEVESGVTEIESYAFGYAENLRAVRLAESVDTIDSYAFASCTGLKALEIRNPSANIYRGGNYNYALSGTSTSGLVLRGFFHQTNADGVESMSTVQSYANSFGYRFQQLDDVSGGLTIDRNGRIIGYTGSEETVVFPNAIVIPSGKQSATTSGMAGEFEYGSDLDIMANEAANVVVVKTIGRGAFQKSGLKEIKYNSQMRTIEDSAFVECNELVEAVIPASISEIKAEAYANCAKLERFVVDSGNAWYSDKLNGILFNKAQTIVKLVPTAYTGDGGTLTLEWTKEYPISSIADGAFSYCTGINKIIIKNIEYIGGNAFYRAFTDPEKPVEVELTGTDDLDDLAFNECTGLKKITFDNYVSRIGSNAFNGCTNLESITVDSTNVVYEAVDNVLYTKPDENKNRQLIMYPAGKADLNYTVAPNTVSIVANAFKDAKFETVSLPDTVMDIRERAFDSCANLTEIQLNANLQKLEPYAFASCGALTRVAIPSTVTEVGLNAFSGCYGLKAVAVYNPDLVLDQAGFDSNEGDFTIYSIANSVVSAFAEAKSYLFVEATADQIANNELPQIAPVVPVQEEVPEEEAAEEPKEEQQPGEDETVPPAEEETPAPNPEEGQVPPAPQPDGSQDENTTPGETEETTPGGNDSTGDGETTPGEGDGTDQTGSAEGGSESGTTENESENTTDETAA